MLSQHSVSERLARGFVGVRLDWQQASHYAAAIGTALRSGDQLLLDPGGAPIPPESVGCPAENPGLYGRSGCDTTAALLDRVLALHPPRHPQPPLQIDWFFWPQLDNRTQESFPPPVDAMAAYVRLPMAFVFGPIPQALRDDAFLQRHLREFLWVRADPAAPSRIVIRRSGDRLAPERARLLAEIDPRRVAADELGRRLDAAWRTYMEDRPQTAAEYPRDPKSDWMGPIRERIRREDAAIPAWARQGVLPVPGAR